MENHLRSNTAIENSQINDPVFALDVYSNLANDYFRQGDLEKAVAFYHRALDMFDGLDRDSKSFAQKYMEISQNYKAVGKLTMSREYVMRSIVLYESRTTTNDIDSTHN